MTPTGPSGAAFPTPLSAYPPASPEGLLATLGDRVAQDPFNLVATAVFGLAVLHTLTASRFAALAHRVQYRFDGRLAQSGRPPHPSTLAEFLHFLGEVEVVFGLWAVILAIAIAAGHGWAVAREYLNRTVTYTEPLFVVVIMALASTRPIVTLAERLLLGLARAGRATPAAWWLTILTVGPLLGSFITEPAAMTICALLLARQFYDLGPGARLAYATLGLLFVNVSIGGTLTHFAAPPVLMVARPWDWSAGFMLAHFGWRAILAIAVSNALYFLAFRRELARLGARPPAPDPIEPEGNGRPASGPIPAWITVVHLAFVGWTVWNAHDPVLFVGGFLFFIGFVQATAPYQSRLELKAPLLVGFFLGGLVIHGGLQGWWIQPLLASLPENPLFVGSMILTAFNDNALITYLATLVPDLGNPLRIAVVAGAVAGGGLTVIANAPNPAGQALLRRFFGGSVAPLGLLLGALPATLIVAAVFRLL